jgi:uncharacterized protein YbjT (DUF2867 family)
VTKVLVTGGSGTLGAQVVGRLTDQGHDVRILSRRPGPNISQGDLATGAGIGAAARDVSVVVHAASDTHRFGRTDVVQTRHLLEALPGEVEHLVYVSIVGIDRIPFAYYRQKLRCEELIARSGLPFTILRATQFHELLAMVFAALQRLPLAPIPSRFRFQPVAAGDVGARIVELVAGAAAGRADDFGGPEVLGLHEMAEGWRISRGRSRRFVSVPLPGRVSRGFQEGHNTCPSGLRGTVTWPEFLAGSPSA